MARQGKSGDAGRKSNQVSRNALIAAKKKRGVAKPRKVANNEMQSRALVVALSRVLSGRQSLAASLGYSYGGDRDVYEALGYLKSPTFDDYYAKYVRQDIAQRIVDAYPEACWWNRPKINEPDADESEFEKAWSELVSRLNVFHYLERVDKVAGIGQYGAMFLGFDDGQDLEKPVRPGSQLAFLSVLSQKHADISAYETDTSNRRFGYPKLYNVQLSGALDNSLEGAPTLLPRTVHYSRILHVAEGLLESNIYGTPRLEPVLNRLQNIELISGGSAEMFWRGGFPGLAFNIDPDAEIGTEDIDDLETEIDNYINRFQRHLRTQGVKIQQLMPTLADPSHTFDLQVSLISAVTGIPKRMLTGSERGELASTQDERTWNIRVDARRRNFCELLVLRPFIDRLVELNTLPSPTSTVEGRQQNYEVVWPDILSLGEKDRAEVGFLKARAIRAYADNPHSAAIMPPNVFLRDIIGLDTEEIARVEATLGLSFSDFDAVLDLFDRLAKIELTAPATSDSGQARQSDADQDDEDGNQQ